MGRSHDDDSDRSDLERAFAGVKPLASKSMPRVSALPDPKVRTSRPTAHLVVERESNGIIHAYRTSTHASIRHALEDPQLEVEAECDLHGFTAREAEREVLRFVQGAQRHGRRWVLIIVGKGLHSPDGKPTLRNRVVGALSERAAARFVEGFHTAPRRLGGTGALVVRLVDRL